MDERLIKHIQRKLSIPLFIGALIFIGSIIWNRTCLKNDDYYIYSIYLAIFGLMLMLTATIKLIKFKRYLRDENP